MRRAILLLLFLPLFAAAQLSVRSIHELSVPRIEHWNRPVLGPDGTTLFLTNEHYNGIWRYDLRSGLLKELTTDAGSGFDFAVSQDGQRLAYRRTRQDADPFNRTQEAIQLSVTSGVKVVFHSGRSIQIPRFIGNAFTVPEKYGVAPFAPQDLTQPAVLFGVMDEDVTIARHGRLLRPDPFGTGRSIWPVLSPDGTRYAAVDMERGAFVANIDGSGVVMLGKCNAPQWTRDGRWLIGMDDRDDGHVMTGSELVAVSADGMTRIVLTDSPARMELYPAVSPTEDTIIFTTSDGRVFQLQYAEGK